MNNIYKILMLILLLSIITQMVSALEEGKDYKCIDKVVTESSPPSDSKITEKPLCSEGKVPQIIAKDYMQDNIMDIKDNVESAQCFSGKCWDFAYSRQNVNNKGVSARLTQHNPAIDPVKGYASFASIMSGTSTNRIETGWSKAKNDITRLFVRWWKNGGTQCSNFGCGWIQTSQYYYPTMPLSIDNYGKIYSIKNINGNWWVAYNGEWIGYYPGSLWNGGFNTGTYALYTGGVLSYAAVTATDMGNGLWASNTNAAMIVSQQYTGTNGYKYNANTYKSSTSPNLYSVVSTGSNSMRYGGPGSTSPKITVIYPNGGEVLHMYDLNTIHPIRWTSSGNPGPYVKIELLNGGIYQYTITYSTPNDGYDNWVPSSSTIYGENDYKIKISSTSNPGISDTSDNNFEIYWHDDWFRNR